MPHGIKIKPTVQPTETDKAYAAGFIDGEGCVTVRINRSNVKKGWNASCYPSLTVSQTDYNRASLVWLAERWGGAVRKMAPPKRETWAQGYEWCIVGQMFYSCMDDILPFLMIKRDQAQNALRLRSFRLGRGHHNALTEADIAMHMEVEAESRRLNQRRRADPASDALP